MLGVGDLLLDGVEFFLQHAAIDLRTRCDLLRAVACGMAHERRC